MSDTFSAFVHTLGEGEGEMILGDYTVLHSKRVDFEYGVLSAAYTG